VSSPNYITDDVHKSLLHDRGEFSMLICYILFFTTTEFELNLIRLCMHFDNVTWYSGTMLFLSLCVFMMGSSYAWLS